MRRGGHRPRQHLQSGKARPLLLSSACWPADASSCSIIGPARRSMASRILRVAYQVAGWAEKKSPTSIAGDLMSGR